MGLFLDLQPMVTQMREYDDFVLIRITNHPKMGSLVPFLPKALVGTRI